MKRWPYLLCLVPLSIFAGLALLQRLSWAEALAGFFLVALPLVIVLRRLLLNESDRENMRAMIEAATLHEGEVEATRRGTQRVLEALPDPLILLDDSARILRVNRAASGAFGPDLKDRDLAAILRNPDLLQAASATLTDAGDQIVEFLQPGKVERVWQARLTRLPDADPEGAAVILMLHDMTAVRRAEEMRRDFVANASHELRTPLTSLAGFIETLQGPARDDPEAREQFLTIMQEQADRMRRLIEDLLSLSRIELLEHSPPSDRVDLAVLLRSVVSGLQIQADASEMAIEIACDDLPPVPGEPGELTQVFQNLVDNALKYGRAGTAVRVTARPVSPGGGGERRLRGAGLRVDVINQGDGIAPEHIPRLTERFYRVDPARSRQLGGTGLGLAIVKHILNRHQGLMEVESEPGGETAFRVYLPAVEETRESKIS